MFLPRAFQTRELARLDALIAENPFITLISCDSDGAPLATQLPVLYRRTGEEVVIEGHFARANAQAGHGGQKALIIVHGPDAHVAASWYPDKAEQARVPTWNYSTAHLHGHLEIIADEAALCQHLAALSAHFEARAGGAWRFDADNPAERVQVKGLIGFRLVPTRIEIKDKLSQNHPRANREAVIAQLAASTAPKDRHIARLMQAALDTPEA